ncbi:MAG: metallophosphoesterase, partial [Acidobacteria bacterium]|nr:metallophosphoesterase [Acidobacteriota bacterium]
MEHLEKLFKNTSAVDITDSDNLVIFSDLHMGDGSKTDDFLHNGLFFQNILENYYEQNDYKLILNGDIDELHRFSLKAVTSRWQDIYKVFKRFHDRQQLFKLVGNHDFELSLMKRTSGDIPVLEALKLCYQGQYMFIFHGHQASHKYYNKLHWFINIFLRFFANGLGIKNYSVAHDKRKKYKIEKRVYDFARKKKIMALIGHTHRPLFESLSKQETLKFKIENLCREYPLADLERKTVLKKGIIKYKKELRDILYKREDLISNLYNSNAEPLVPCMFNSGCAIGKSGITSIE